MNLALFDFDNTITTTDTFTEFVFFAADPTRIKLGKVLLLPYILGYQLGLVSPKTIRAKIVKFAFKGRDITEMRKLGKEFAENEIPKFLNESVVEKLKWHEENGDKIVIVSGSLDLYLQVWCEEQGYDVLCSVALTMKDKLTGNIRDVASNKKQHIEANYNLKEFHTIYAYGDSKEDKEMLELANEEFRKYFN